MALVHIPFLKNIDDIILTFVLIAYFLIYMQKLSIFRRLLISVRCVRR